jgi:ATP-dependent DNA helicase RecQ
VTSDAGPLEILRSTFGYEGFRPHQEQVIRDVLSGRDVLAMLPTGSGKSLCFQLPSLMLPRPTVVVSPLIALMKDQVDGLPPALYPKATLINSSLDSDEVGRRCAGMEAGDYRLVYVAPERLRQQSFLRLLERVNPSMVVVDEAHCVALWGHDFRPDYLFIRRALNQLSEAGSNPRVLALTATATQRTREEIRLQLGRPLDVVAASTFRPNLRFEVSPCAGVDAKARRLVEVCRETPGAAIVYAGSRERCEKLSVFLRGQGLQAAYYHAGMTAEARRQTQERFMLDRVRVMVATIAFGMGVDKPNVRLVAHFSLPESLESYTQEAGRAGRDGRLSRCVLLFSKADKANRERWQRQEELKVETVRDVYRALRTRLGCGSGRVSADELQREVFGQQTEPQDATLLRVAISALERCGMVSRNPDAGWDLMVEILNPPANARAELEHLLEERRAEAKRRLAAMVAYAEGGDCRHSAIARHFGQALEACGDACDCCRGTRQAATEVEKAVAPGVDEVPDVGRVILRTVADLPFGVGRTGLAKVLLGATDSPISRDRCATAGSLAGFTRKLLLTLMGELMERELLAAIPGDEYHRIRLTPEGLEALGSDALILPNPMKSGSARAATPKLTAVSGLTPTAEPTPDEADLFERLRAWRRLEAQRAQLPPYTILQDATLHALSRMTPGTIPELGRVPGIGPAKLERYGEALLSLVRGEESE